MKAITVVRVGTQKPSGHNGASNSGEIASVTESGEELRVGERPTLFSSRDDFKLALVEALVFTAMRWWRIGHTAKVSIGAEEHNHPIPLSPVQETRLLRFTGASRKQEGPKL